MRGLLAVSGFVIVSYLDAGILALVVGTVVYALRYVAAYAGVFHVLTSEI